MEPTILAKTNTSKFILPLLVKDDITYNNLFDINFNDAYITHSDFIAEYDSSITVKFIDINFIGKQYAMFDSEEIDYLVTDNEDGWKIIYKLKDIYATDYVHFLAGEYSLFSERAKRKIINFWKVSKDSLLYSILYKYPNNIDKFIKKANNHNNPWNKQYTGLLNKLKNKKELYKAPNLNSEIDFYIITEGDI